MKIRTKIILSFFLLAFFGAIFGSANNYLASSKIIKDSTLSHLQTTSKDRANHVETYLQQNIERLKLITSKTQLRIELEKYNIDKNQLSLDKMKKIIKDSKESVDEIERICIIGLDGVIVTSTDDKFCGKDIHTKVFFQNGKRENDIYFVNEDNLDKMFVSGPFILDNELLGVGITVVKLDKLEKIVKDRTGLKTTGEVLVAVRDEDQIRYFFERLFEQEAIFQEIENLVNAEPIKQALMTNEMVFENTLDYRDEPVFAVSEYIELGRIGLVAKIDQSEALGEAEKNILFASLITFFVVVIFVTVIGFFIANMVVGPIIRLQEATKIIGEGKYEYKTDIKSNDEIGLLALNFEKMAAAIKESRLKIDRKVEDQTSEIVEKQKNLENQQKAVLNILEDVEEEKENVSKERDKINAILHSIGDGVFVVDIDLKITMFNQIAADLCGCELAKAIGKKYDKVLKFVYEKDGKVNNTFITQAISTGEIQEMSNHTLLIKKDGKKIPVADSAAPLKDRDGKVIGCVVVFRDVTKEYKIDKMKTEFVSLASHQLRTPLSAIKWFLEMVIGGDAGKINEEQKDYLQQAFDSNERMVRLVNGLLNVSRIETGRLTLEPEPTDLIKLSQVVINELIPMVKANNLNFKFTKPSNLPKVNIDPKLISQVIINLLSNAVKYTKAKGKIELKVEIKNKEVVFLVKDSGLGIPKEQQKSLFNKFFRADNVTSTDTEGTGLGLYVAKSVVESSGGKIGFRSVENKGSTFWFTLPLAGSKLIKGEKTLENNI